MDALAVILHQPELLALDHLDLTAATDTDVVVDVEWSGISTGTERLLYTGQMPAFPGMGYPLVPGYESVGRIVSGGAAQGLEPGTRVFVPGARCFGEVRGLFGGAASRLVVPGERVTPIGEDLGQDGILLALAATAYHAVAAPSAVLPDLIVGHGVLGRLLARVAMALGAAPPTVWESNPQRAEGAHRYKVIDPSTDQRRNYRAIYDVSGSGSILDTLVGRLTPGGEITLAGFYSDPLSFTFPPAFMREARFRVAAEWKPADLAAAKALISSGRLSLSGLVTHARDARQAPDAYRTAFGDPGCLKMVLDWRSC